MRYHTRVWIVLAIWIGVVGCEHEGIHPDRTYNLAWIHGTRMERFDGSGSVIGIREAMFDLRHPEFAHIDLAYNNSRQWNGGHKEDQTHGTHILGILAADSSLRGLAPKARYALTSTPNHNRAFEELEEAGAEVINSSFVMADYAGYSYLTKKVTTQTLHAHGGRGIVHVFAAGNQGESIAAGVTFPAAFSDHALIVGELDEGDLTLCSNYGKDVDVFVQIPVFTTNAGGGYGIDRGSSCSTAVVTAVMAHARTLRPDLNATTLMRLVCATADHIGDVPYDLNDTDGNMRSRLYGCGSLNADAFLDAVEAQ